METFKELLVAILEVFLLFYTAFLLTFFLVWLMARDYLPQPLQDVAIDVIALGGLVLVLLSILSHSVRS